MKTIPEQDLKVAEFLRSIGIDYAAQWQGVNGKKSDFDGADKWLITFKKAGKFSESFTFNTGPGNRYTKKSISSTDKKYIDSVRTCTGSDEALIVESKQTTQDRKTNIYSDSYTVTPTQASVLYCLLSDAECGSMSFDDFCSDFGYDNDSMKDFKTYQACMQITQQIRHLFTCSERETLQELLQDY